MTETTTVMKIRTKRRYSNNVLEFVEFIGWHLTVPWKYAIDHFLACFIPVTVELKQPWVLFITFLIFLPLYALASIITLPPAMIGFCMIVPIRSKRLPYLYSFVEQTKPFRPQIKKRYCIGSANICLLPDYMSRINNLHNTYQRTLLISDKILQDQFAARQKSPFDDMCNGIDQGIKPSSFPANPYIAQPGTKVEGVTKDFDAQVLEKFPEMDILMLQVT